jgi:hypothetical protein
MLLRTIVNIRQFDESLSQPPSPTIRLQFQSQAGFLNFNFYFYKIFLKTRHSASLNQDVLLIFFESVLLRPSFKFKIKSKKQKKDLFQDIQAIEFIHGER